MTLPPTCQAAGRTGSVRLLVLDAQVILSPEGANGPKGISWSLLLDPWKKAGKADVPVCELTRVLGTGTAQSSTFCCQARSADICPVNTVTYFAIHGICILIIRLLHY